MSEPKDKNSPEWRDWYLRLQLGGECVILLKSALKKDFDVNVLLAFITDNIDGVFATSGINFVRPNLIEQFLLDSMRHVEKVRKELEARDTKRNKKKPNKKAQKMRRR